MKLYIKTLSENFLNDMYRFKFFFKFKIIFWLIDLIK